MGTYHEDRSRTVAILSIGDMGAGVARLLVAKGFRVVTDTTGRSADTISRAQAAHVESLPLSRIVTIVSAVLSIVPPADAKSTVVSVLDALSSNPRDRPLEPLFYVDLNAVAPATARDLASLCSAHPDVRFVDGAIIGGPPTLSPSGGEWEVPHIPLSGPVPLPDTAPLSAALRPAHIGHDVGLASGLKMCFASLTKGYTAVATQSFTTAHRIGVLPHLWQLVEAHLPDAKARLEKGVTGMPPKAYRWVREMEEIGDTHRDEGGWRGADMFGGAARIFEAVAGSPLGREKVAERTMGFSVADVAGLLAMELGRSEAAGEGGEKGQEKEKEKSEEEGKAERDDKPNPMKRMWEEDKAQRPG